MLLGLAAALFEGGAHALLGVLEPLLLPGLRGIRIARLLRGLELSLRGGAMDLNPPRGTRDFYPEEMALRTWLFGKWREIATSHDVEVGDRVLGSKIAKWVNMYA